MSKYTTEVRYICEQNSGYPSEDISKYTPDQIISASRQKIFNFTYPIYEETHRAELETKILKHYYTREIGAETVGLWKLWLNERMNLIMPKYNTMYAFEKKKLGKEFSNIDIETHTNREDDFTKTADHTRTQNLQDASDFTTTENKHYTNASTRTDNLSQTEQGTQATADKFSDTPQGTVSNVDNNTYLTEYRKIDGTSGNTTTNTGTQTTSGSDSRTGTERNAGTNTHTGTERNNGTDKNFGNQEIITTETGYRGDKTYFELMSNYAEKILTIDQMIIRELSDLFILLW